MHSMHYIMHYTIHRIYIIDIVTLVTHVEWITSIGFVMVTSYNSDTVLNCSEIFNLNFLTTRERFVLNAQLNTQRASIWIREIKWSDRIIRVYWDFICLMICLMIWLNIRTLIRRRKKLLIYLPFHLTVIELSLPCNSYLVSVAISTLQEKFSVWSILFFCKMQKMHIGLIVGRKYIPVGKSN